MVSVAIVGATGYTGLVLTQLCQTHPFFQLEAVYARQAVGKRISEVYPHLADSDLVYQTFDPTTCAAELVFLATPHQYAHTIMAALVQPGRRIVDLSADFRLLDTALTRQYYGFDHQSDHLYSTVSHGYSELYHDAIKTQPICANPGCYPTAVNLGLAPLSNAGLLADVTVIADCKSGVSGAGRAPSIDTLYTERQNNFMAYKTGVHRHTAEIEGISAATVLFSPHLAPYSRGIFASLYIPNPQAIRNDQLIQLYQSHYLNQPFIQLWDQTPAVHHVSHSNNAIIQPQVIGDTIVIFSVIDNMLKGASGQAIQNANIMYGLDQTTGLPMHAPYL